VSATRDRPKPKLENLTPTREYVVLVQIQRDGDAERFESIGVGRGATDVEAIRDATRAMSASDRSRPFVAIAKSRFNIRSRKVEMVERESWN
jgi:hypothetical protein